MSNILLFPKANPIRFVITEWENRLPNDLDYKFWSEVSYGSWCQPFETGDTISFQFWSSFGINSTKLYDVFGNLIVDDEFIELVEFEGVVEDVEYEGIVEDVEFEGSEDTLTVPIVDNGTYTIYQVSLPLIDVPEGKYYFEVTGTQDAKDYTARSEIIEVKEEHCNTSLFSYYNFEPAFDIDYRSGVTMQIRMPAYFNAITDENEFDNYVSSIQEIIKVTDETIERRSLEFWENVPLWFIQKVNLALAHDYNDIDGLRVVGGDKLPFAKVGIKSLFAQPSTEIQFQENNLINRHDSDERILF